MRSYFVEVIVDGRPIHSATYEATNEHTAAARAGRHVRKETSLVRRTDTLFVYRVRKLAAPKATGEVNQ